ncbi:hypothetical protein EXIGLDRAFT_734152, partial [Exidia glandulosa HHB12029]
REHLDANETKLSDGPVYSGLYGRKKVQTTMPRRTSDDDTSTPTSRVARKASRGAVVLRNKDTYLAVPESVEPSQLPLPPSPVRSIIADVREAIEDAPTEIVQQIRTSELLQGSEVFLENLRTFVSNSTNIATLTVVSELLFVIYSVVPWSYLNIPLTPPFSTTPPNASSLIAHIPYPPLAYLLSTAPYSTLFLWSLPTLLIPQLFGALISFSTPRRAVDPLSAAIVRVACAVAGGLGVGGQTAQVGVSWHWRVLAASVAAAFALSEAVESAGQSRT